MQENNNQFDLAFAIDFCDSALVFVDNSFNIQYVNFKALKIFQTHEHLFENAMPNFKVSHLIGMKLTYALNRLEESATDFDIEHIPLGQSINLISNLENITFNLKYTPIMKNLKRIGTCIEFSEITGIVKSKNEFHKAIHLANQGDFSYKINTSDINNQLFNEVFEDVNHLFDTLNSFIRDIYFALENISSGDLTHCYQKLPLMSEERKSQICPNCKFLSQCESQSKKQSKLFTNDNYYNLVRKDFNYTVEKLWNFVDEIQNKQTYLASTVVDMSKLYNDIKKFIYHEIEHSAKIQQNIENHMLNVHNLNTEITQATYIKDIALSNIEAVQDLKNQSYDLKTILEQIHDEIKGIREVSIGLENMLFFDIKVLQDGLLQVEQGNLGRGINIISKISQEIVHKSKNSLKEINNKLSQMDENFIYSHDAIHGIVENVLTNSANMNDKIDILGQTMSAIQGSIQIQENTIGEIQNSSKNIQNQQVEMLKRVEKMLLSIKELMAIDQHLEQSLNVFRLKNLNAL